ncbi:hypothetical protein [Azospirillum halopraeferens]|uniref:hypothetical protein n=1 Tax=Azospirillum halopraeferens TaxID=34010 RepID=UPI0012ECB0F2|nr:hypothetical protein [Azospirillum halopraeferens]
MSEGTRRPEAAGREKRSETAQAMEGHTVAERHHLWAVANLLVGRYGAEARARARENADEANRAGDGEVSAFWTDVDSALPPHPDSSPTAGGPA